MQRSATVDIAKGICIVLVVLGHSPLLAGEPNWVMSSFRMPLFFALAGLFLKPSRGTGSFVAARFHLILKPYFVVCFAMILAKSLGAFSGIADEHQAWRLVAGTLHGTGATVIWTPLWFLPHLFAASCTTFLLLKVLADRPRVLAAVAALLLALGVQAIGRVGEWPWSADLLPITVALMLAGWRWREAIASVGFRWAPCTVALLAFFALHLVSDARLEMNGRLWDDLFVCTAQAALGTYLVLAVASALQQSGLAARALTYVGTGSLFVLLFHHPVHARVAAALQAQGTHTTTAELLAVTAAVLLPLLVWEATRRIPPLAWLLLPPQPREDRGPQRGLAVGP